MTDRSDAIGPPSDSPRNVRAIAPDGTVTPLELVYRGLDDGIHVWEATAPVALVPGSHIAADTLPARTEVRVRLADG